MRTWIVSGVAAACVLLVAWVLAQNAAVSRWLLSPGGFDFARLELPAEPSRAPLEQRDQLRAFYSGHSLSDWIPEEVARIAGSKGQTFDFDVESLPGSLLRERVERRGSAGFVAADKSYDAMVVTERHDLPYAARFEQTAALLQKMHEELLSQGADAQTFFYHVWLEIDFDDPAHFVRYERQALGFWECVASAVNLRLPVAGVSNHLRVLPGGAALAELVERLLHDEVAGAPGDTARARVQGLFQDRVHPSSAARYFMGAVHYATLFESSPIGGALPPDIAPSFGLELQRIAWQYASAYTARARAAAERDMAVCRDYATQVMCPLFEAHPRDAAPEHPLRLWKRKRQCQSVFADPEHPDNPFH